mmetsp:Transcript_27356/g.56640  ORF Transcript_27356/g.56640 Transcript_27356/m.56640 type:complete len:98 (-) Transcript_27356:422-715(-)
MVHRIKRPQPLQLLCVSVETFFVEWQAPPCTNCCCHGIRVMRVLKRPSFGINLPSLSTVISMMICNHPTPIDDNFPENHRLRMGWWKIFDFFRAHQF